ncbi:hypothetical protein [Streptomyces sp. NPDC094149]|uniref:hypothetical protein n=1 Tax=Streptomyces sp. NPDC094149 TaxID=3155079 RepID=UPI003320EFC8
MATLRTLIARLRGRRIRLARVDSLGTVLDAAAETGAVVQIPGIAHWLYGEHPVDSDYQQSVDGGFTESFEDYCTRISRQEA